MKRRVQDQYEIEIGCDEAGRGPLSGPVVGAAVYLPKDFFHPLLNDSKQVNEKNRGLLEQCIKENAIDWAVGVANVDEIDSINILNATFLAIHRAIYQLKTSPDFIAMDGNRFAPYANISHQCIIKGDSKYMHIAAASILAKTHRDKIMMQLHEKYPNYEWDKNKGYPTKKHREFIQKFGVTKHHRKSFRLLL